MIKSRCFLTLSEVSGSRENETGSAAAERKRERRRERQKGEERATGGRRSNPRQTERKRDRREAERGRRERERITRGREKESAVGSRESAAALSVMNPKGRCETTRTVRIFSSPMPGRCMQKWLKAEEREVEWSRQ